MKMYMQVLDKLIVVLPFSYPVIFRNRFGPLKFSTDTSNSLLISKVKPKFSVSCEQIRNKLDRDERYSINTMNTALSVEF